MSEQEICVQGVLCRDQKLSPQAQYTQKEQAPPSPTQLTSALPAHLEVSGSQPGPLGSLPPSSPTPPAPPAFSDRFSNPSILFKDKGKFPLTFSFHSIY